MIACAKSLCREQDTCTRGEACRCVRERPILFSAPMVCALLAGTKTQTRREVKVPHGNPLGTWEPMPIGGPNGGRTNAGDTIPEQSCIWHTHTGERIACPYGEPGDKLWVREAWRVSRAHDLTAPANLPHERGLTVMYAAGGSRAHDDSGQYVNDDDYPTSMPNWAGRLRPGMFMPRWASRILLEIDEIRVERLNDISGRDAVAEGIEPVGSRWRHYFFPNDDSAAWEFACNSYASLWESINGKGSWDANPWVFVICFRRIAP